MRYNFTHLSLHRPLIICGSCFAAIILSATIFLPDSHASQDSEKITAVHRSVEQSTATHEHLPKADMSKTPLIV